MSELDQVLAAATPERVREIILDLYREQSPALGSLVVVERIAEALVGSADVGQGQERGRAYERVYEAIREAVSRISDIEYIYGNA